MIRIGTAGFAYKDWEGPVYPAPRPPGFDPLAYLAGFFDCLEMNVTFYRVPTAQNVAKWVETVAGRPDFRFTFKLYRGLTHGEEDESVAPFLEALAPCRAAGRLGAILLQFPFFFRNTQAHRARLARLAGALEGWPCAVEVRDRSWLTEPARDFLRRLELSLCDIDICQTRDSVPPGSWTTGPLGYVRLHGRNREAWFDKQAPVEQKYNYLYSAAQLEEWADLVREIAAQTDSTYVITNNHFGGKAVANAFQLARLLVRKPPAPPPRLQEQFPGLA
ncbi:MAG: DUF72 domain-containing protein [Planctomycetota bacterium]|jgi:uncharacterized protein YecE (DUF72 family)